MSPARALAAVLALGFLLAGAPAGAVVVGQPLPSFTATDLNGNPRHASELRGQTAVVVVIPSRGAAKKGAAWTSWVHQAYRGQLRQVDLVALDLPFFISRSTALHEARNHVPQRDWGQTWLGVKGQLQDRLNVEESPVPYVLVLDGDGRVVAEVHGIATPQNKQSVAVAISRQR